eukprot:TRINITY_DN7926_c0_g1_i1.p1 TRINITY_DN7926_c0_g1~~TRINITY_DN7926_c0_g1_i1.p1  ORF type:complete len:422 (+),score=81.09 TRINITY_DN7926_c0_g1_i1:157-1266(+)
MDPNILIAYVSLLVMAIIPIWIGSHVSLSTKATESMTTKDAWMFPFIGSVVLFGLYLLFKVFHKDYINMLLSGYFLLFGVIAVSSSIRPLVAAIFPFLNNDKKKYHIHIPTFYPLTYLLEEPVDIKFDNADIVSFLISLVIGGWYFTTKNWISNNILGLAFSIQGIALLSLGTYRTGCLLLSGLFIYDVFWVFGTEVMVSVAKSFDAPVKLLFPKDLFAETLQFSMLGLGDIVIPGVFIALLLRFDQVRASSKKGSKRSKSISRSYFLTTYIAYILGLATTVFVMHTFQAAQPALLYLVPFCIGASFLKAVISGETATLLEYSDNEEERDKAKKVDSTEEKKPKGEEKNSKAKPNKAGSKRPKSGQKDQ